MKDVIELKARYGYVHQLKHIDGNLWKLEFDPKSGGYYRCIGFSGDEHVGPNISAIDPDGGPYIHIGYEIDGKIVKSITNDGIIELE